MTDTEKIAGYELALRKIAERSGPFSRDQLTHAGNTIEAMGTIADRALVGEFPDADD